MGQYGRTDWGKSKKIGRKKGTFSNQVRMWIVVGDLTPGGHAPISRKQYVVGAHPEGLELENTGGNGSMIEAVPSFRNMPHDSVKCLF